MMLIGKNSEVLPTADQYSNDEVKFKLSTALGTSAVWPKNDCITFTL